MRISDWSSDVCSSDLGPLFCRTFAIVSHGVPRRNRGGASGVVRPLNIPTPCGGRPKKWGGPPDMSGGPWSVTQRCAVPGGSRPDRIRHRRFRRAARRSERRSWDRREIGRAHVCTPVTNAHLVCRLLLAKKKKKHCTHIKS